MNNIKLKSFSLILIISSSQTLEFIGTWNEIFVHLLICVHTYVYMHVVCACMHATTWMWRSENNLGKLILSFYHVCL